MAMAAWGQPEAPAGGAAQPETIEELAELRLTIMEEMSDIRNQLVARKADVEMQAATSGVADRYGKPLLANPVEYASYTQWRARATAALRHKELELGDVNAAIKTKRRARGMTHDPNAAVPLTDDPVLLLGALVGVARRLAARVGWDNVDAADKAAIDYAKDFLTERG